ncbi:MAG: DUF29 domain-containing protein [Thioploca sp.]|nr:DUF29 domain-containing protein [Thioploca sp.]
MLIQRCFQDYLPKYFSSNSISARIADQYDVFVVLDVPNHEIEELESMARRDRDELVS